jgi:hypothetical protein
VLILGGAVDLLRGDKEIIFAVTKEILIKEFDFEEKDLEWFEQQFEAVLIQHMLSLIKEYEREEHRHKRNHFEVI